MAPGVDFDDFTSDCGVSLPAMHCAILCNYCSQGRQDKTGHDKIPRPELSEESLVWRIRQIL